MCRSRRVAAPRRASLRAHRARRRSSDSSSCLRDLRGFVMNPLIRGRPFGHAALRCRVRISARSASSALIVRCPKRRLGRTMSVAKSGQHLDRLRLRVAKTLERDSDASACYVSHPRRGSRSGIRATVCQRQDIARQLHRRGFHAAEVVRESRGVQGRRDRVDQRARRGGDGGHAAALPGDGRDHARGRVRGQPARPLEPPLLHDRQRRPRGRCPGRSDQSRTGPPA